jgi:hypothetical protein
VGPPTLHSRWLLLLKNISIFSNSSHLEWRAGLSDTILKGTHQGAIPARFGLIWFSGFRGDDLNAIFYQNMPNLHNRYISGFFMNFELLPILTDYEIKKKGGMKLKINLLL